MSGSTPPTTRPPRLKPEEVEAAQRRAAEPKRRPARGGPPKEAKPKARGAAPDASEASATEAAPVPQPPAVRPPRVKATEATPPAPTPRVDPSPKAEPPAAKAPTSKPPATKAPAPEASSKPAAAKAPAPKAPSSEAPAPKGSPKPAAAKSPDRAAPAAKAPVAKEPAPKAPAPRRSSDGRVVVHPRLQARRVEVQIDAGRRRLRRIAWAAGIAASLLLLAGLTQSPLLAVRHIRVSPTAHTSAATLQAASGIRTGGPMLDVDSSAAVTRLQRLPWVRTVAVHRVWPATVRIVVTERHPVAQISQGTGWLLVDVHGRALARVATPPAGLVRLVGLPLAAPGKQVPDAGAALRLTRALPTSVRPQVAWIAVDPHGALALRLRSGGKVVVGSLAELDAKMVAVATMLGHLQPHSFCTVDVQVPNAPTLTRASACA